LTARLLVSKTLDSASKIGDYHRPLLQVHGTGDSVIPFALGQRLFDAANEPKRFITVPGGDHNDPPTEVYLEELGRFVEAGRLQSKR
jgi:hypothetical protein